MIQCILTQSTCYKGTTKGRPVGVLWHDTAAGNSWVKRYAQPSEDDPNRDELLRIIGKNTNGNDWNHKYLEVGVNAFIGRLADGSVGVVQTLPFDFRPWGCGSGRFGSCNGSKYVENSPFWIQFEICDDAWSNSKRDYTLGSKPYFEAVYDAAVNFTAELCKTFGFDPHGTFKYNGVNIPVITCHYEAFQLGFGSGHTDVLQWFKRYGKTMASIRDDVAERVNDMTREETAQLIRDSLAPLQREIADLKTENQNLRNRLNNELGQYITTIEDVPWANMKAEVRKLLDLGVINGGTPAEENPDDIGLPLNILRALVCAARYTDDQA